MTKPPTAGASLPTQIVVASKNPVKAAAIEGAFQQMFPDRTYQISMFGAPSGVADQPRSNEETRLGAENRVAAVRAAHPQADLWAGLEGGVEDTTDGMQAFAWILVQSRTVCGAARTATFPLPQKVVDLIRGGMELGAADDQVFRRENSKQGAGAIGILTNGLVDRRSLYEHAAIMAMIPLQREALFHSNGTEG